MSLALPMPAFALDAQCVDQGDVPMGLDEVVEPVSRQSTWIQCRTLGPRRIAPETEQGSTIGRFNDQRAELGARPYPFEAVEIARRIAGGR